MTPTPEADPGKTPNAAIRSWYPGAFATPPCSRRHVRGTPLRGGGGVTIVSCNSTTLPPWSSVRLPDDRRRDGRDLDQRLRHLGHLVATALDLVLVVDHVALRLRVVAVLDVDREAVAQRRDDHAE